MTSIGQKRKNDHISLALKQASLDGAFDDLHFVHHALPNIRKDDVDLTTTLGPLNFETPFFINAMTGGSEKTKIMNQKLAIVAKETGLAMASGSVSIALKETAVEDSFTIIRQVNPEGLVLANLGAGKSVEEAQQAVELLNANALQLHLNAPQELIMPEGDQDFSHWLASIAEIVAALDVPVIVKEVGFGMSRHTYQQLITIGVNYIDVSGRGGTNFASIENKRRRLQDYGYLEDWGQSTAASLLEAQDFMPHAQFIASGGIRHPLDMVKSFALGARLVGLSGLFLHSIVEQGVDETIELVHRFKDHLKTMMTLLGKTQIMDLTKTDIVIQGELRDYCLSRGINIAGLAQRI